jgi:hypothetical protein
MMANIRQADGEWICDCGNSVTDQGFWPCDEHGEVTDDARSPYTVCAKCGRVMDDAGNVLLEPHVPHFPITTKATV